MAKKKHNAKRPVGRSPEEALASLYEFAYGDAEESFVMPIDEVEQDLREQGIDPDVVALLVTRKVLLAIHKRELGS